MAEPRYPFAGMSDAELDRALAELGASIRFPPTPDLASAVLQRIALDVPPTAPMRFPVRRILAAAAIVLIVLAAGLLLSSGLRSAVADLFGVRGVRIEFVRETPTPTATAAATTAATPSPAATPVASPMAATVGTGLLLGRAMTLEEAQAEAPYRIHVPALPALGQPDEVYVRTLPDGNRMVSLIYLSSPELPEAEETGVGLLLMQFEARDDVRYIGKNVGESSAWLFVDIGGGEGLWIEGAHQLTLLPDPSLGCCEEPARTAGNVLLWEQDGLTFRMESALTVEQAVAIAESVAVPAA
jgi:hypothetical protein